MSSAAQILQAIDSNKQVQATNSQSNLDIVKKTRTSVMPWRGQFSPQLIEHLIQENAAKAHFICDPFCGSGTVLFEAARKGIESYGSDINPAAVTLAKVAKLCKLPKTQKDKLLNNVEKFKDELFLLLKEEHQELVTLENVKENYFSKTLNLEVKILTDAFLITSFANGKTITAKKLSSKFESFKNTISNIPSFSGKIDVKHLDARKMSLHNSQVDYILTSPPYINVFNYHQNYRAIIETLGFNPLPIAKSEIGANRKFRQNRFLTVVQYCMDMAEFFNESTRVLNPAGSMTIVLGRESNVRGVSFKNGELVLAVARDILGWNLKSWHERSFVNRFGKVIIEDVFTLLPPNKILKTGIEEAREIGIEALRNNIKQADLTVQADVNEAIEKSKAISLSPYTV